MNFICFAQFEYNSTLFDAQLLHFLSLSFSLAPFGWSHPPRWTKEETSGCSTNRLPRSEPLCCFDSAYVPLFRAYCKQARHVRRRQGYPFAFPDFNHKGIIVRFGSSALAGVAPWPRGLQPHSWLPCKNAELLCRPPINSMIHPSAFAG